jgi:hypothetical protein
VACARSAMANSARAVVFAGAGWPFDHEQTGVAGERRDDATLRGVEVVDAAEPAGVVHRSCRTCSNAVDQICFDREHVLPRQAPDVPGDVIAAQQRHASCLRTVDDVLDQLVPDGSLGDHADRCDQSLDLAADVCCVPRRPLRAEPGEHEVSGEVAVDPADLETRFRHRVGWWGEAEVAQLAVPRGDELGAAAGRDLVRPGVRPRASVPGAAQTRPGLLVRVLGSPVGFVSVDVAVDLCGALAEPAGVRRQLLNLAVVVEGVATCRERGPELGVAHHGGVTDPVERLDAVDDADRVQSTPRAAREDPCVDLHVEVAVRVAGARGVVAHDGRLDHLHRHLHLPTTRSDPGGGVLGHPNRSPHQPPGPSPRRAPSRCRDGVPRRATRTWVR